VAVVWALLRAGSGRLYIVGEVGHRVMAVAPLEDGRHAHEAAVAARPRVRADESEAAAVPGGCEDVGLAFLTTRHALEAAVAARPGVGAEHRSNSVTQLFIAAISGQEDTLDALLRGCGGSGPVEGHGVYDPVTESCDGSMLEHTKRHFCLTTVNEGC